MSFPCLSKNPHVLYKTIEDPAGQRPCRTMRIGLRNDALVFTRPNDIVLKRNNPFRVSVIGQTQPLFRSIFVKYS